MKNIALFGGTFDPIHLGHLNVALNLHRKFDFDEFYFVPCKLPILKNNPHAKISHRLAMLKLALAPYKNFGIDTREINRKTPSYTLTTLKSFPDNITFIVGSDGFANITKWYQWQELILNCNILVITRKAASIPTINEFFKPFITSNFNKHSRNKLFFMSAGNYEISSTLIRNSSKFVIESLVPSEVFNYIIKHHLYGT